MTSHPVAAFAARAGDRFKDLAGAPIWSMSDAELRDSLLHLARVEAQLTALKLGVLAEADRRGATDVDGSPTAAEWLAVGTQQTRSSARADLGLARSLETQPILQRALTSGEVLLEQARVIATAVDRLPTKGEDAVTDEQRADAEAHLVGLAADHDAKSLRVLGHRLFEVIAPEKADEIEGRLLEAQETRARRRTRLVLIDDGEGMTHFRGAIPTLNGAMWRKALWALTDPASDEPREVARGQAFCDLLERLPREGLSKQGGCTATVVVTMTEQQLRTGLGAAGLDTDDHISAGEARRLACTAGIIPAVLGGQSQLLDLGRRRRFHTETQRIALALTQQHCTAEGCDTPPALCHAHHDQPWSAGGGTSVQNGRLLCGHHHRRIHDPAYDHTTNTHGRIEFHQRT
jgi:hypothetical protein